ncbi:peptidase [Thermoproteus sp. CP80]|uniref:M67 family metallopeptidase n=1 Tax=Thermoproteus sp. CP80 TaxID=1650659 RepID=UPI0009BEC07D|nr:M67 family metallopeptidase [Thermoproteus sp. CP80]PLC66959.1 peptidase [Thermoproteus sp. CP80]
MRVPRAFVEEARGRCNPDEECAALLFGVGDAARRWAWMENAARSPVEFRLDPERVYRAIADAERLGLELVAIFHTHPGAPVPSPLDLRHMAMWPVVWIIGDVRTMELRAWRLERGVLREVDIYIS